MKSDKEYLNSIAGKYGKAKAKRRKNVNIILTASICLVMILGVSAVSGLSKAPMVSRDGITQGSDQGHYYDSPKEDSGGTEYLQEEPEEVVSETLSRDHQAYSSILPEAQEGAAQYEASADAVTQTANEDTGSFIFDSDGESFVFDNDKSVRENSAVNSYSTETDDNNPKENAISTNNTISAEIPNSNEQFNAIKGISSTTESIPDTDGGSGLVTALIASAAAIFIALVILLVLNNRKDMNTEK